MTAPPSPEPTPPSADATGAARSRHRPPGPARPAAPAVGDSTSSAIGYTSSASRSAAPGWLSWHFILAVLFTGLAAGLGGVALTLLLHAVQHLAFGYTEDTFLTGVERAGPMRRVLAVGGGGAVVGVGWWLHRRLVRDSVSVTHALTVPTPYLPVVGTSADAAVQILAVGVGASLGREGAPRQLGAALGGAIAARLALSREQRRVLLAAGAGAGLAAVYNVPLAGAAFTVEVLLATIHPRAVIPAVVTAALATVTAWPVLGARPTYQIGAAPLSWTVLAAAPVLGAVIGLVGVVFRAVMTLARTRAPAGFRAVLSVPIAFTALGACAIAYPQLLGNGKGLAQLALTGTLSVGLAAVLAVMKSLATALCLRSGAIGGLLTPSFATGASLGLLAGDLWSHLWPGGSPTLYALLGAAALLGVTQRAPITAVILALEFTHSGPHVLPAVVVAVAAAGLVDHVAGTRAWPVSTDAQHSRISRA